MAEIIGTTSYIRWIFTDPYTDAFWLWLFENEPSSFDNWDTLTGSQKMASSLNYELATGQVSVRKVSVYLSRNNGVAWTLLASNVLSSKDPSRETTYRWVVTGPACEQAYIKIVDQVDGSNLHIGDLFSIEEVPVVVVSDGITDHIARAISLLITQFKQTREVPMTSRLGSFVTNGDTITGGVKINTEAPITNHVDRFKSLLLTQFKKTRVL